MRVTELKYGKDDLNPRLSDPKVHVLYNDSQ